MAARLDVRTWTALPAAGSALDARQALDVGSAARRADLGRRSRGVRRSTLRQALDVAARLDVRTWTALPARGRRSTLRQALSCARVIRIFLGQPCRTALLWVWVGEATWPVAGLLHRPRRRYRARSRTGGGQGRSGSTWQRGSTCGPGRRSRESCCQPDASTNSAV